RRCARGARQGRTTRPGRGRLPPARPARRPLGPSVGPGASASAPVPVGIPREGRGRPAPAVDGHPRRTRGTHRGPGVASVPPRTLLRPGGDRPAVGGPLAG